MRDHRDDGQIIIGFGVALLFTLAAAVLALLASYAIGACPFLMSLLEVVRW